MQVEGIQVHADEGGITQTRGRIYWLILPAGYLGSSFWGMVLILASTNLLTARIAAGCFVVALLLVLCVAKNVMWNTNGEIRWVCCFLGVVWILQETTKIRILRYIILFIGVMNSLFSVYDIYDDLISRRVHCSDAEKFAEVCPCPCNGVGWGVIWGLISLVFLCGAMYIGLEGRLMLNSSLQFSDENLRFRLEFVLLVVTITITTIQLRFNR
ncbi:B120-like protein [Hibiscus syriacus]|uniref:B120-like protein n=1 Tax=Hibiscus syriacus TaxID=106335 RepID=A0A6A2YQ61_HIBSY|nr:B120-like protein [Hibiscus syriacus]